MDRMTRQYPQVEHKAPRIDDTWESTVILNRGNSRAKTRHQAASDVLGRDPVRESFFRVLLPEIPDFLCELIRNARIPVSSLRTYLGLMGADLEDDDIELLFETIQNAS